MIFTLILKNLFQGLQQFGLKCIGIIARTAEREGGAPCEVRPVIPGTQAGWPLSRRDNRSQPGVSTPRNTKRLALKERQIKD